MQLLRVLLFLWVGLVSASAQIQINPGDPALNPRFNIPTNRRDWRDILTPQQCPSGTPAPLNTCGDGRDGYGFGFDSFSGKFELRPPKILYGPGAITSNTGITQNAWNNLYGSIGANGFRSGLTAYIPRGNYEGYGQIAISGGGTSNASYTVRVLMGTCPQATGSQQGILTIPQVPTNAGTAAGSTNGINNVLNFAATACISPGMTVYDTTHAIAIGSHIVVCSVTSTTVTLTADSAYPSCTSSGFVTSPGVSNGDTIMFGYVSGYGGPYTWPGGASLPFTIPYSFNTSAIQCLAADRSNQQCEMFTQVYTTGSGDTVLSASGQVTNPPYSTYFLIKRLDGGYGGL